MIELPFAPTNVQAERLASVSQRAVNVSWTPGFDGNSPVSKYIIQKREVSDLDSEIFMNWITELSNVSSEQRWVLLTNLKAAATYQFRVSAVNSVGEGSPSEPSNLVILPQEGKFFLLFLLLAFNLRISFCFWNCSSFRTAVGVRRISEVFLGNHRPVAASH